MAVLLEVLAADGAVTRYRLDDARSAISARPGSRYRLIDENEATIADGYRVRRVGDALVIDELPQARALVLERFFADCTATGPCVFEASGGSAPVQITPESIPVAALQDDSFLMLAGQTVPAAVTPMATTGGTASAAFGGSKIGLLAGVLGVAAALGGGGGGGSDAAPPAANAGSGAGAGGDPAGADAGGGADDGSGDGSAGGDGSGGTGTVIAPALTSAKSLSDYFPVLEGTAAPTGRVEVRILGPAGDVLATFEATADADGFWRIDTGSAVPTDGVLPEHGLPEGELTVSLRPDVGSGDWGPAVNETLIVDRTAPDKQVDVSWLDDDVAPEVGWSGDGVVTNDATPGVLGRIDQALVPGERVAIWRDGARVGYADLVDTDWSFADGVALADGSHQYHARVEDAIGNLGPASAVFRFTVDTLAPAAASIAPVTGDDLITASEIAAGVTISGRVEPGAQVFVSWGNLAGDAFANTDGDWSVRFAAGAAPPDGVAQVRVDAVDAAGNVAAPAVRAVVVDSSPPPLPGAPQITAAIDNRSPSTGVVAAGESSNDATPLIQGRLAAPLGQGEVLHLVRNGVDLDVAGSSRLSISGSSWQYQDSLSADAGYRYEAYVEAADGRAGDRSAGYRIILDRVAPDAPSIDVVAGNDRVATSEARGEFIISGEAEASSRVTVSWGIVSRVVQAGADGVWHADFTGQVPGRGYETVYAAATDAAGNISGVAQRSVYISTSVGSQSEDGSSTLRLADLTHSLDVVPEALASSKRGAEGVASSIDDWLPPTTSDPLI
ncbi:MAG: hypothetical protein H6934_10890 [Burkholderiaceae bacterium]|nr:hypothetical protein [Burkholderiaceae bacterium]